MSSKNDKLTLIGISIIAIIILIFAVNENSIVFLFFNQYTPIIWEDILERNIVRSSIPIEIILEENGKCVVTAKNFDAIIDHKYFVRSNDLVEKLGFDRNNETLSLSCDMLKGEKSRLNVWFVVEESDKHSKKYEFFVTPWEEISKTDTSSKSEP